MLVGCRCVACACRVPRDVLRRCGCWRSVLAVVGGRRWSVVFGDCCCGLVAANGGYCCRCWCWCCVWGCCCRCGCWVVVVLGVAVDVDVVVVVVAVVLPMPLSLLLLPACMTGRRPAHWFARVCLCVFVCLCVCLVICLCCVHCHVCLDDLSCCARCVPALVSCVACVSSLFPV